MLLRGNLTLPYASVCMISDMYVPLTSGARIPAVGLGVYQSAPGQETYQAVRSALKLGYRHVDTAQCYRNEADVGRALKDSEVPREEVWVTTKLWLSEYGVAAQSIRASLERLGLQYVDLLLLHAPGNPQTRVAAWKALEDAKTEGIVKHIGVSNFGVNHLEKLFKTARMAPEVNQLELSPFLQRRELVEYCKSKQIVLQAYSPLCKGEKLGDPTVKQVASKHGLDPAQVLIKWSLQKGFVPLPKSVTPARQKSNLDVFGTPLAQQDMDLLDGLEEGLVTGWDPVATDPV